MRYFVILLFICSVSFGATLTELKTEFTKADQYKDLIDKDWKTKSAFRGIEKRSQKDFTWLESLYPKKITAIRKELANGVQVDVGEGMTKAQYSDAYDEKLAYLTAKEARLVDKLAAVVNEQRLRKEGKVVRTGIHHQANYYLDYDNGTNCPGGTVHDGLAEPADPGGAVYTMIDGTTTSTDSTHAVLAKDAFDNDTDDDYNGDYLYNITRSTGVIITDYDADDTDDGSVLIHPEIASQVATDTFYILRACEDFNYFTTTSVRTPGDVIYVRANITWDQGTEAADIIFDEDGNVDNYISIIGCDATTNDPWVDASDVKPIIDFEDAAFQFNFNTDSFWWLERLDIRQSADTSGNVQVLEGYIHLESCDISDSGNSSTEGLYATGASYATVSSCTFSDCWGASVYANSGSFVSLTDCTLDAGSVRATTRAIYARYGSVVHATGCSIAPTNAFATQEVLVVFEGKVYLRNCTFGQAEVWSNSSSTGKAAVYSEDNDGVFEAVKTLKVAGYIERDTGTVRTGGADSSAKMTPDAQCGPNSPLILGDTMTGFARYWAQKDVAIDISVYASVGSAWDSALTAAECYAKFSYLSNGSTAARTEVDSTEQIDNDTTWDTQGPLTSGSITPLQTGWVYIWLYLEEYEDAGEHIFVDIRPVVTD